MFIFGKIFGSIFGYLMLGNVVGMLIGMYLGHIFDKSLKGNLLGVMHTFGKGGMTQKQFFKTTFLLMGYLAKLDGRVSEREIHVARTVMDRLSLDPDQKREAIAYFTQGKDQDFDFESTLGSFAKACRNQRQLAELFLELLVQSALADGRIVGAKRQVLTLICKELGIPLSILYSLETQFQSHFNTSGSSSSYTKYTPPPSSVDELTEAYKVLGIDKTATDAHVKKAYRKVVSQNHPDKLVSKGLPPEMIKIATEKTQKIHKAYELIQQTRGMR